MQLVLTLPGLLAHELLPAARAPHLARLLALAGAPARRAGRPRRRARRALRHRRVQADWPLAPIRVQALGVDPGAAYWLCADPVTLVAGRDDVRLTGPVRDLSADRRRGARRHAECAFRARRRCVRRAASRRAGSSRAQRTRRDGHPPAGHGSTAEACALCCPPVAMPAPGGAGRTKSRCCCTNIRSTSRASVPAELRRTASGSPRAARCPRAPPVRTPSPRGRTAARPRRSPRMPARPRARGPTTLDIALAAPGTRSTRRRARRPARRRDDRARMGRAGMDGARAREPRGRHADRRRRRRRRGMDRAPSRRLPDAFDSVSPRLTSRRSSPPHVRPRDGHRTPHGPGRGAARSPPPASTRCWPGCLPRAASSTPTSSTSISRACRRLRC